MSIKTVYICPTDKSLQCSWEGESEDILEHFIMEHEDLLLHSSEVDINLSITSENRLLFSDGEIYLIQFKIHDDSLNIGLRYLGPRRIANSISYDIVLKIDGQHYMYNYFENGPSIFGLANGFWIIDLHLLNLLHQNLTKIQCNFSISKNVAEINIFDDECINTSDMSDTKAQSEHAEEDCSELDTVIELDEIEEAQSENAVEDSSKLDTVIEFDEIEEAQSEHAKEESSELDTVIEFDEIEEAQSEHAEEASSELDTVIEFDEIEEAQSEHAEEDSSEHDTVIELEEIEDILQEDIELRKKNKTPEGQDALDNMSNLNFNILESSRYCRRYSSFMSIPFGLFDEKEIIDLTCSNCSINMLPPIFLCVNNHNICADCRNESCKLCSGQITENRNKELEDYSRKCLHLCRYHSMGCMESFMYNEIRNHEIKCKFCIYKCIQDCTFRGKFFEFLSHFKLNHSSYEICYSTPVDFPRNKKVCVCDNDLGMFYCTSSIVDNNVSWTVKYLGPKDRNFSCELTFKRRKLNNVLFLKRVAEQYSIAFTKEDLKKMKVKDKNAVLTITSYFN